jgi:hypothetical protein
LRRNAFWGSAQPEVASWKSLAQPPSWCGLANRIF